MASMSMPPPMSSIKPEPQVKQESISQLSSISHSSSYQSPSFYHSSSHHQYGQQPQQQQHSYSSLSQHQYPISSSSSSAGSVASFSNMSPTSNYGLPRHITNLNMSYSGSAVSPASNSFGGIHTGASSAPGSGAATPAMSNAHLTTNGLTSTPSSPNLSNLQYHPSNTNNSGGNSNPYMHSTYPQSPYQTPQQQQQPHSYQHQSSHANDLNSSGYYGSSSPTYGSHPQQQQSGQGQQPHHNSGSSGSSNGSNSTSGSHIQFNPSTAPSPMRQHQQQQYTPLVPPLSETQYAQYHQLLGSSAFSSAQSTPYHSNHSTPYSSMPGSPTRDYQPLNDTQVVPKPKRRQVKNACVNCQKACKKCDEGRPCARCIKYGLTETCVDSTRKVRKKGIKRGPYKRRPPPTQIGSATASTTPTTPTMRNAMPSGIPGYMSEPVTALNSPTQSHMLPITSTAGSTTMGHTISAPLDFGYDNSGGPGGYSFHSPQRMETTSYAPSSYATNYSGSNLYESPYGINSNAANNLS